MIIDAFTKDADRYIYLLAHMGRVEEEARKWNPTKHAPLLVYLQNFIDEEMFKLDKSWIEKQRKLLNG